MALQRHRAPSGHDVAVDLAAELPLVYVDQNLVEQALGHVIENAMKYSPPGSPIRIAGRIEDGKLAVTVADRGAGITAEEPGRLGERFFRGDRASATTTGSGLGLWIAKAFLHANGGSLDADSDGADRGSTVILRLPIPAQKAALSGANLD